LQNKVRFSTTIFGYVLAAHLLTAQQPDKAFRIAGYLPEYRVDGISATQVAGLTDLIVFSVEPRPNGALATRAWPERRLDKARALAAKAKVRLLLAVGGWGRSAGFPGMASNPLSRQRFVSALVIFCQTNGFAGVVYDWEFPSNPKEEVSYGLLFRDTKLLFAPKKWSVECAVNPARSFPRAWVEHLDAVQVMSYDNGTRHSTYAQAEKDLDAMAKSGAPANKLLLGLPFYGRQITNRNNVLTYAEIKQRFRPGNNQDEAGGFYFNGPDTLAKKVKLAKKRGLGGVMIWEIGQDAKGKDSLLKQLPSMKN
jgi:GH18 family chitinase